MRDQNMCLSCDSDGMSNERKCTFFKECISLFLFGIFFHVLKKECEDYFSNVTFLELDGHSRSLTKELIECLRKIVNPFHLIHLDRSEVHCIGSLLLSHLLEKMPQLSTLKAKWKELNDPERSISQIENELKKQNVIYNIKTDEYRTIDDDAAFTYDPFAEMYYSRRWRVEYYDIKVCIWRDNDITCSNRFQPS